MQGVWVNGERPETKQALIEAVKRGDRIEIEELQFFGSWYAGPLEDMPEGALAGVVGPDPFIERDWFATLRRERGQIIIT